MNIMTVATSDFKSCNDFISPDIVSNNEKSVAGVPRGIIFDGVLAMVFLQVLSKKKSGCLAGLNNLFCFFVQNVFPDNGIVFFHFDLRCRISFILFC